MKRLEATHFIDQFNREGCVIEHSKPIDIAALENHIKMHIGLSGNIVAIFKIRFK